MNIVLGLDFDSGAARSFTHNFPNAEFLREDITTIDVRRIERYVASCGDHPILFSGCAPCQPFSKQRTKDGRPVKGKNLLDEFGRFVQAYRPHFVFCENVPGLQTVPGVGPFRRFTSLLTRLGYHFVHDIVDSQAYGVPQKRRRLILLASRIGPIALPRPTHGNGADRSYSTVWEWIGDLPRLRAGETNRRDPMHRSSILSPLNLERIKATPPGGTRRSWPDRLVLRCHRNLPNTRSEGHTDVYGRLRRDAPASAMTTRCTSLSNGRFGHPRQHRAISLREAACLQTFPRHFVFHGNFISMARQVGNAVPVLLAKRLGSRFVQLAKQKGKNAKRKRM